MIRLSSAHSSHCAHALHAPNGAVWMHTRFIHHSTSLTHQHQEHIILPDGRGATSELPAAHDLLPLGRASILPIRAIRLTRGRVCKRSLCGHGAMRWRRRRMQWRGSNSKKSGSPCRSRSRLLCSRRVASLHGEAVRGVSVEARRRHREQGSERVECEATRRAAHAAYACLACTHRLRVTGRGGWDMGVNRGLVRVLTFSQSFAMS